MRRHSFFLFFLAAVGVFSWNMRGGNDLPDARATETPAGAEGTREAETSAEEEFSDADLEFFEKEIRPILASRCYECHSVQSEEVKGGLRVDSRSGLLRGGDTGPAIVPGQSSESLLIQSIRERDPYEMPPDSHLPQEEIGVLVDWIDRGAAWPPEEEPGENHQQDSFDLAARRAAHWAWQPLAASSPPTVHNPAWRHSTTDRHILARLEAEGLEPAAPADRYALIRRIYFDLIGLPPSPEEVEAFVQDEAPDAYEKVVDRLLASDHYGERWVRHWMDVMRYGESHGHEFDFPIDGAWQYRDYLIRALNADVPYDDLVVEHIAGDLLPEPRMHPTEEYNESVIGTGFWFLGEGVHAPTDVRGDEANRIDNQIDTMTKAFLGLTVGCARCHDHKFDAISTKDYYALAGYLQSSRRVYHRLDPQGKIVAAREQINAISTAASDAIKEALPTGSEGDADRFAEYLLAASSDETASTLDATSLERWRAAWQSVEDLSHPLWLWTQLHAVEGEGEAWNRAAENVQCVLDDQGTLAANHRAAEQVYATFDFDLEGWFRSDHAFSEAPTTGQEWEIRSGRAQLARPGVMHSGLQHRKLEGAIRSPTFTIEKPQIHLHLAGAKTRVRLIIEGFYLMDRNDLLFDGVSIEVNTSGEYTWVTLGNDLKNHIGRTAYLEIVDEANGWVEIDEIRFSDSIPPPLVPSEIGRALLSRESASREELAALYGTQWANALQAYHNGTGSVEQIQWINWVLDNNLLAEEGSALAQLDTDIAAHIAEVSEASRSLPRPIRVLAMTDGDPEDERVHIRGSHLVLGEREPRHLPTALLESVEPRPMRGSGRLQLAEQIADPKNPLTARVYVNRIWHHLFGRGIVKTVDNFGVLGEMPTHPELLDALAREFMQEGWSTKKLIRSIVLSNTYQMRSQPNEAYHEVDPDNLLLHRMPIRRLEGEAIRDAILAVSGRLAREVYGPSTPIHLTSFMQGRGRPTSGPLDGDGRRSIYIAVRRNFLSPFMLAFDTPVPFAAAGRRTISNVPAQSLILMNDPFVAEEAKRWAEEEIANTSRSVEERIEHMYLLAFSRLPDQSEIEASLQFIETQGEMLEIPPEQRANNVRVWTDLCHVYFNVKEFVFLR